MLGAFSLLQLIFCRRPPRDAFARLGGLNENQLALPNHFDQSWCSQDQLFLPAMHCIANRCARAKGNLTGDDQPLLGTITGF